MVTLLRTHRPLIGFLKQCEYLSQKQTPSLIGFVESHNQRRHFPFWEESKRGHRKYDVIDHDYENMSILEKYKNGFKILFRETRMWINEWREKFHNDPKFYFPGDTEIMWKFKGDEDAMKNWHVVADSTWNEGFSECEVVMSPAGHMLFRGYLDTRVPKTGKITRSGYVNLGVEKCRKSFFRDDYYEWARFTHLVMRVRGDGRAYRINLSCSREFDLSWFDQYHYGLYTHGGPYWQYVKIPFSKFYFASKGRVQDDQFSLDKESVNRISFTLADKTPGPFHLEIEFIGCQFDPSHEEEFAYEMYKIPEYRYRDIS